MADLTAFWQPFTATRDFMQAPRMLESARGMYYYTPDGREILDGFAGLHGAFSKDRIERNVKMCEPRTLRDPEVQGDIETTIVQGEEEIIEEFTPVPMPRSYASVAGDVGNSARRVTPSIVHTMMPPVVSWPTALPASWSAVVI